MIILTNDWKWHIPTSSQQLTIGLFLPVVSGIKVSGFFRLTLVSNVNCTWVISSGFRNYWLYSVIKWQAHSILASRSTTAISHSLWRQDCGANTYDSQFTQVFISYASVADNWKSIKNIPFYLLERNYCKKFKALFIGSKYYKNRSSCWRLALGKSMPVCAVFRLQCIIHPEYFLNHPQSSNINGNS